MSTSYYANTIPLSYTTPSFPSLYWPFHADPDEPRYLYTLKDVWRFTLYWSLIFISAAHLAVALWAVLMQFSSAHYRTKYLSSAAARAHLTAKNRALLGQSPFADTVKWVWLVPVMYLVIGGLEALLAGSLVGLVLGAVYNSGYFRMSTWTPLLWGIINMLVLILSSFRVQGGL